MKTIKFYKEDDKWYADVEGHTKEDNEMVLGSDSFLELFSKGADSCHIDFDVQPNEGLEPMEILTMTEHNDEDGAFYSPKYNFDLFPQMYLCNVMHTVCGEHPETIYIYRIY